MENDTKHGPRSYQLHDSIIGAIRARQKERNSKIAENDFAGESIYDVIRKQYQKTLMTAIQEHTAMCALALEEKFGGAELWDRYDATLEHHDNHCPECGSNTRYSAALDESPVWLGLGETENCHCGASYEHWYPGCRKPLASKPINVLLDLAARVEGVYGDARSYMTHEQIALNRTYLGRIFDVLVNSDRNHCPDRFERSLAPAPPSNDEAYSRLFYLMDEIDGPGSARAFIKYGGESRKGLNETIAELELELTAKTLLGSTHGS